MDSFELKKKDFRRNPTNKRPHRLPLMMQDLKMTLELQKYYEKRSSSVLLTHEDFKSLFDPVVEKVIDLIQEQVDQIKSHKEVPIETIILVGGFGSSPYLKEALGEWCTRRAIRLTTPISGA
jgi:tRNA A37 threonylcarbamoyltransferase TsaD